MSAGCFLCVGKSQHFPLPQATLREAVVFKVFIDKCAAFVQMAFYVNTGHETQPEELLWGGGGARSRSPCSWQGSKVAPEPSWGPALGWDTPSHAPWGGKQGAGLAPHKVEQEVISMPLWLPVMPPPPTLWRKHPWPFSTLPTQAWSQKRASHLLLTQV